jgi:Ca-activated chloride channel family protein
VEGASPESGGATSRIYPKEVYDLFAGEQLVMVGRYKRHGNGKVTVTGKIGDKEQKLDFPATFVEKSNDQSFAFVEKLWAMRRIGEIIDEIDLQGKNDELVKELVALSTKHGILTPYTSFLADENAPSQQLADTRFGLDFAGRAVDRLEAAEGVAGVAQRAEKNSLKLAQQAAPSSAPAFGGGGFALPAGASPAGGSRDASSLARGGIAGRPGPRASNAYREIDTDKEVVAESIQNAGGATLYRRGKTWIANSAKDIDPEKDEAKIKRVKRFSEEYFELVKANTQDENTVLATQQEGEELLVVLRGQAYRIE